MTDCAEKEKANELQCRLKSSVSKKHASAMLHMAFLSSQGLKKTVITIFQQGFPLVSISESGCLLDLFYLYFYLEKA